MSEGAECVYVDQGNVYDIVGAELDRRMPDFIAAAKGDMIRFGWVDGNIGINIWHDGHSGGASLYGKVPYEIRPKRQWWMLKEPKPLCVDPKIVAEAVLKKIKAWYAWDDEPIPERSPSDDWRPIDTAPKDCRPVNLAQRPPESEMRANRVWRWDDQLYVSADGHRIWALGIASSPTHWRPANLYTAKTASLEF